MTRGGAVHEKTPPGRADEQTMLPLAKARIVGTESNGKQRSGKIGMGVKDLRRERAVRRIWESVIATVVGGLILWSVTSSMSQPTPTTERTAVAVAPALQPTAHAD